MRKAYQSDLSDEEWSFLKPLLPSPEAPGYTPCARSLRRHLLHRSRRLRLAPLAPRLPSMAHRLDGLITNDKFCFTRRSRLKLRPKRRGYPSRNGVRRGGIDETQLDRSARDGQSRRRRPSLGPSLCAPPPLGGNEANHDEGGGA